jgi:hypothetical protein
VSIATSVGIPAKTVVVAARLAANTSRHRIAVPLHSLPVAASAWLRCQTARRIRL